MDPKHITRKRALALAVAGVACIPLSGCLDVILGGYAGASALYLYTHPEATEENWSEVRVKREPQAEMVQYRHDVAFPAGQFNLTSEEGQRLESFITRVDVEYGDTVILMAEPAEGVEPDTASRLTQRRAQSVSEFLALNKVDAGGLHRRLGDTSSPSDTVTVVVRRHVVTLPACPDWTDESGDNSTNQPSSNWSCATATNLGMMVADPGDLARGRDAGYADGELLGVSIENYRKSETEPLRNDVNTQDTFKDGGGFRSSAPSGSGSN